MNSTPPNAQTPRLRSWQVATVGLLVAGYSGYYFCRSNLSVSTSRIIDELAAGGMDRASAKVSIGYVVSYGTLAYAAGKLLGGAASGRLGGRRLFLLGMAGAVLGTLGFAASRSVPAYTIAWVGNRLLQSVGWLGLVKIASRWFSHASYGTVMGVLSVSYLWGDWAFRMLMGSLFDAGLTWRMVFAVAAATLAALFAVNALLLKESPGRLGLPEPSVNPANVYGKAGEGPDADGPAALLLPLLRSPTFLMVCLMSMGFTLLRETFNQWIPLYYRQALKMSDAEAAYRSARFPLLGGFSVLIAGAMSDRLGRSGRAVILFLGLIATAALLLALGGMEFGGSTARPVLLVTTIGFVMIGPYSYLAGAVAMDFGGKRGGATASGLIDCMGYIGGTLAGAGVAELSARYGWGRAFLALAGVALLTSVAAGFFWFDQSRLDLRGETR